MRQIKLCLLGCLTGFLLLAVAGSSLGGAALSRDDAGARAALPSSSEKSESGWTRAARVQNKQIAPPSPRITILETYPNGSFLENLFIQIRLDGSVRDWLVSGCDGCPALGIVSLQHGRLDLLVTTTGKMLEGGKGPSHLLRITGQVD